MKKDSKEAGWLIIRYLFIVLIGLGNLYLFYKTLTPATVFVVSKILALFTEVYVFENLIILNDYMIELIPACVGGSAFFLLFLLVFSTGKIKPFKRILLLVSAVAILFILNAARILFLISIAGKEYFNIVHWTLWNLVSIFFVVGTWFFVAWIYKIGSVPIYSDILFLRSIIKGKKTSSEKRKNSKRRSKNQ